MTITDLAPRLGRPAFASDAMIRVVGGILATILVAALAVLAAPADLDGASGVQQWHGNVADLRD